MQVWQVLTDYERLPEVVPNLAVCERVAAPTGMSSRVTRLRQVTKVVIHAAYICLPCHATAAVARLYAAVCSAHVTSFLT